jgi:uncharacterized protein YunC (DUF1805 family)
MKVLSNVSFILTVSCLATYNADNNNRKRGVLAMIHVEPITLEGHTVIAIEVILPKTTLIIVTTGKGYIMCGALDISLLNERLKERNILAARATGVRTIAELLDAPLESVTDTAKKMGVVPGMKGREAILRMV